MISLGIAAILFLVKIVGSQKFSEIVFSNIIIYENYRIVTTLCICFGVVYMSILLEQSTFMKEVGTNGMSIMGLEYITHSYIPLSVLPMLNLGIPNMVSTVDVITMTLVTLWINCRLARGIKMYFPVLNGNWRISFALKETPLRE